MAVFAQTASSVAPVASRLTQAIDEKQLVPLKGTVHRLAAAANDRGAVDDGLALDRIQVVLKRSDAQETALKQTIEQMHTPGTATYHKWLTPDQFGKQFGPSDEDVATLTTWLGSHGFSVTKVNAGRQTMEISGSAGQFRQTFHTQIHKYQVNGQTHYANAADPEIPAAVAPVFGGFASLNNFQLKSHSKVLGKASYDPATHKTAPEWTIGDSSAFSLALAPGDFAVQYDLNPLYSAGTTGTGQTIAIINESNISVPLVNQYRTLFGLPANAPNVILDGNDPGIDGNNNPDGPNGASGEAYLDVELAGAVAPGATIDLVIGADTALESGLALAAQHAVYGNVAPVLSLSFGNCEAGEGASQNAFWNGLWEQAAAQGQTVLVSTGDAGSAGCDDDNTQQYAVFGQQVSGIASSPWNVAVGGTDFFYSTYNGTNAAQIAQLETYWNLTPSNATPTTSLLQKVPEQPWNNSQYGSNLSNQFAEGLGTTIAGGSGGASNCATGTPANGGATGGTCKGYAKPAWQTGTGVPADGVRDLPDLSLFASNGPNGTFYPVCLGDGDCQPVAAGGSVQISGIGGTSASTPSFAGIMALVNQKYGPQGQADFVLYPMAKQFPAAFNDVVNGTNAVPCAFTPTSPNCIAVTGAPTVTDPTYGTAVEGEIGNTTTKVAEYNAGTGYDLASGLGTIDATNLVNNWGSVTFTASTVTLTPSSTSFAHGTAVTISGAVTPSTSTGAVALMTTSTQALQAGETTFTLAAGAYSGSVTFLPGGSYTIYGKYSGDGTNAPSTSTPVSVTVTPENSTTSLFALNTDSAASGQTIVSNGGTIAYGTQVELSGEPAASSGNTNDGIPTGSVIFADNGSTISTAQVNVEGDAESNVAFAPGSHSVVAKYSGDASYNASTSSPLTFTVAKNTPQILLSESSTTVTAGTTSITVQIENTANSNSQTLSNAAYVNPALAPTGVVTVTGLPSGTLTFPALASATDPNTLFVEGVATLPIPTETAGTYTVTVSYPGDANYNATSGTTSVTITAATGIATTTTATANLTATGSAAAVNVTATVTGTTAGGFPTGTLLFTSSGTTLGTLTLPTSGTGDSVTQTVSFTGETLYGGANVITVQYSGSTVYQPSFGTVTISNGGTAGFTLGSSGGLVTTPGGSATGTVTVTPVANFTGNVALTCAVTPVTGTGAPTCTIASPATIVAGATAATLTVNTTAATGGSYVVTVTGTSGATTATTTVPLTVNVAGFALNNSGAISETAGSSGTSSISVLSTGALLGNVGLTCTVAPTTGTSVPTCAIASTVASPGSATLTVTSTTTTTAGAYTVTVTGTSGSLTASTTVAVTVAAVSATETVTLANSGAITIAPGATTGNTSTITVTPAGGFTGSVALSCSVSPANETDPPTCSISSPIAITGTTAGTATLTVSTTTVTAAMEKPKMRLLPIGGGVALAGLLFCLVPVRRRRLSTLLGALVLMVAIGFSAGCGGGGSSTPPGGGGGTTAGTYTVTVSGTATGVNIAPITVSVTVN